MTAKPAFASKVLLTQVQSRVEQCTPEYYTKTMIDNKIFLRHLGRHLRHFSDRGYIAIRDLKLWIGNSDCNRVERSCSCTCTPTTNSGYRLSYQPLSPVGSRTARLQIQTLYLCGNRGVTISFHNLEGSNVSHSDGDMRILALAYKRGCYLRNNG